MPTWRARAQVAVADADLALVRDGAGDAEGLQAHADAAGSLGGALDAFLHGDGGAQLIGPLRVLEADGLRGLDDLVGVDALGVVESLYFIKFFEAILVQNRLDLRHTTFIILKQSHSCAPPITLCAGQST